MTLLPANAHEIVIMVVDDEPENIQIFERALRGYTLITSARGDEALAMLAEHDVDIIVTDQLMPGANGSVLLERAWKANPFIRRVVVSAYSDAEHLLEAINRGHAHRYLLKPVDPKILCQELASLVEEYRQLVAAKNQLAELQEQLGETDDFLERRRSDRRQKRRRFTDRGQWEEARLRDDIARLEHEFARSDRYGRPLTLLVVQGDPELKEQISPHLREVDIIVQIEDQIVILLPETNGEGASITRQRLGELFPGTVFRLATCPDDGRHLRALLAVAR